MRPYNHGVYAVKAAKPTDATMTIPEETRAASIADRNFDEDLLASAQYEFRLSREHCGACADYHAVYSYGRLAGLKGGIGKDEAILAPLLAGRSGAGTRLLIAGSADAGLLAFTARATMAQNPAITVADRCETPLAVCRRFAQSKNIRLRTDRIDFNRAAVSEPHDLAFAHNVLVFVPESLQIKFLRNIGRSLTDGGTLILVSRGPVPQPTAEASPVYRTQTKMIEGLKARGVPLPESEHLFRARSDRLEAGMGRMVSGMELGRERMEAKLLAAGFDIALCFRHEGRRHDDGSQIVPTFVFVASRRRNIENK